MEVKENARVKHHGRLKQGSSFDNLKKLPLGVLGYHPAMQELNKDSLELCVTCREQNCSVDLRCDQCVLWSADKWSHVQAYSDELQKQHEEREVKVIFFLSLSLALTLMTDQFLYLNIT